MHVSTRIEPCLSFCHIICFLLFLAAPMSWQVCFYAPWAALLPVNWFWASCWGKEWEEQNQTNIYTHTYTHSQTRTHFIDTKGHENQCKRWILIARTPSSITGKIKVENKHQKITNAYSRWRHYCKQSTILWQKASTPSSKSCSEYLGLDVWVRGKILKTDRKKNFVLESISGTKKWQRKVVHIGNGLGFGVI